MEVSGEFENGITDNGLCLKKLVLKILRVYADFFDKNEICSRHFRNLQADFEISKNKSQKSEKNA